MHFLHMQQYGLPAVWLYGRITATLGGCWFAVDGRERGVFRRRLSSFRCEEHATRVAGVARGYAAILLRLVFVLFGRMQHKNEDLSTELGNRARRRHTVYQAVPKYKERMYINIIYKAVLLFRDIVILFLNKKDLFVL